MTLTLLDLYNTTASQEWAMYDSDAVSQSDMESSLVIAINKALTEILYSYPFKFREKTHVIMTIPRINSYEIPKGIILKDKNNDYRVQINSSKLEYVEKAVLQEMYTLSKINSSDSKSAPKYFSLSGKKIFFYPTPKEKFFVTIDYQSLAIGENLNEDKIYALKNATDTVLVPEHLEELLKNAVIARTMLNSIASESDENFSAYKKQSETAYRLLIKYSKGLENDKSVKI